jgi:hypothetical protein
MPTYDYFTLTLKRGPVARAEFVKRLGGSGLSDGGKVVGLFVPQLGWEASHAALLVEHGDPVALTALTSAPEIISSEAHKLAPTNRPTPGAALEPGGIYVHRWFEVDSSTFDEFIALSAEAWPDFEGRFDARIFGLFDLTSARAGDAPGRRHLLLLTRYASHGVWEDSRDPTTAAMQTFARRALLTLSTRAASTLLVLPPPAA